MGMNLGPIADAIVAQLASGTLGGSPLRAVRWGGGTGEVRPNSVLVLPPAFELEPLGEGFRVKGTNWPLMLHAGTGRGEVTDQADFDLLDAVLDALTDDTTLGGAVICATPITGDRPRPVSVGAEGSKRTLLAREITLHIDH